MSKVAGTPAIETRGLRKQYGDVVALGGVDLSVEPTVFGLLGPNGAGTTTAVRILTTLLAPGGGSASVAGFDVVRDGARVRERIGLAGQYAEAANGYGFTLLFPITFISSAIVSVDSMPGWLQPFAEHNPITVLVDAVRALFIGSPAGDSIWGAVVWCLIILAVFAPLSAWRYRRAVTR
jgi:ABC-type proline/glycine betaine transport system ATPase subunit